MNHGKPVSPALRQNRPGPDRKEQPAAYADGFIDEDVTAADVVYGDPIVGNAPDSEYDTVIRGLKSPREMSEAQFELHCLTHIPYDDACEYCVAAKKPNLHHRQSTSARRIPLMVADYGFLTEKRTDDVVPFLVAYTKPWRVFFSSVVDRKGVDPIVGRRLAR